VLKGAALASVAWLAGIVIVTLLVVGECGEDMEAPPVLQSYSAPPHPSPDILVNVEPSVPTIDIQVTADEGVPLDVWVDPGVRDVPPQDVWTAERAAEKCRVLRDKWKYNLYLYIDDFVGELPKEYQRRFRKDCIGILRKEALKQAKQNQRQGYWEAAAKDWQFLARLTKQKKYQRKVEKAQIMTAQAQKKAIRAQRLAKMRQSAVADNGIAFWISETKFKKCLGYECGRGDSRFLMIWVETSNTSSAPQHINPIAFTLTSCRTAKSLDNNTFGLNHLDSVVLQPGNRAGGWLVFYVNTKCDFQLNYNHGYRQTTSKDVWAF